MLPLLICAATSAVAGLACLVLVPRAKDSFIKAGLRGTDLAKRSRPVIAESMGAICGLVYLIALIVLLPVAFPTWAYSSQDSVAGVFSILKFPTFLSALLSIQSMIFLGFADDVLNIRWRNKIALPALAALPLLIVYGIEKGVTFVVVPQPLRSQLGNVIDLGILYYIYMAAVAVFCTNAINILAGINGVEVGQSVVIGLALLVNSSAHYFTTNNPLTAESHLFALYLILPFTTCSLALLKHNWYPASVFVGDTYTYFAGMVFAVTGILCHFSKTLLLFFLPQIFNFVLSAPQIFGILPCPRHRLPQLAASGDRLVFSRTTVPLASMSKLARAILNVLSALGLVHVQYSTQSESKTLPTSPHVTFSNLTLINVVLVFAHKRGWTNGLAENVLALNIIAIQVLGSFIGLFIRYGLAGLVYP